MRPPPILGWPSRTTLALADWIDQANCVNTSRRDRPPAKAQPRSSDGPGRKRKTHAVASRRSRRMARAGHELARLIQPGTCLHLRTLQRHHGRPAISKLSIDAKDAGNRTPARSTLRSATAPRGADASRTYPHGPKQRHAAERAPRSPLQEVQRYLSLRPRSPDLLCFAPAA
jgi:hypothetical protein